jgi:hypothetical protein
LNITPSDSFLNDTTEAFAGAVKVIPSAIDKIINIPEADIFIFWGF